MCGLFGIAYGPGGTAAEDWQPSDLMSIMYPAIIHRGRHAWGYMYHERGSKAVEFFKKPGSAAHKDAPADMVLTEGLDLSYLSCHVRYATHGSPSNPANNHPIRHGDVIGMHNGKLTDWESIIETTGREDETSQVDSEAIFAAVNLFGVKDGLRKIKGDMVSIFADLKDPGVLFLARTNGRPLIYGTTEAGSLIWASEADVIRSTGIKLRDGLHNWNQTNKVMRVENGVITNRWQFRKPDPVKPAPPARIPTVMGSRPAFSSSSTAPWKGSALDEALDAGSSALGGGFGRKDKFGGTYIGANMYRVETGGGHSVLMDGEQYIDWAVEREIKRRAEVMREARARRRKAAANVTTKEAEVAVS